MRDSTCDESYLASKWRRGKMPSFGYPRGVSQSARICPETRQREERGQIGRRKRRRITCSCWGQGHASTMIRGVIPQEVE
jgi:hypothetical protein